VTTKKLVSTKDLALLIKGEDIIYRLKGERRGGRYTRGFCESRVAQSTLPD
jgi:hypothetical protein